MISMPCLIFNTHLILLFLACLCLFYVFTRFHGLIIALTLTFTLRVDIDTSRVNAA